MRTRSIAQSFALALWVFVIPASNIIAQDVYRKTVNALVTNELFRTEPVQFAGLDEDTNLRFQSDTDDSISIALDEFIWWNGPMAFVDQPLIHLTDGSVLAGQVTEIGVRTRVSSKVWEDYSLPTSVVKYLELQMPMDARSRQQRLDEMKQPHNQTRVWLTNGDVVAGDFSADELNDSKGSVKEFPLMLGGRPARIPLSRIAGISFPAKTTPDESGTTERLEFALRDGSCLRVRNIAFSDHEIRARRAGVELLLRQPVHSRTDSLAQSLVCGIRNITRDEQYLSQSIPAKFQHQPFLGRKLNYQLDRSIAGTRIRFANTIFPFGIGVPSRSSMVFRIDKPDDEMWLCFGVAMDPSSGERGRARCQVLKLQSNNQWETDSWSAEVRGNDTEPRFGRIDVGGCRAIALTVDYNQDADVLDRVNWIMPGLIR